MKRGSGAAGQRVARSWCSLAVPTLQFVAAITSGLSAQQSAPPPRRPAVPQDTALAVYLMTMGPGKQVWERFGHNAIWIHDPVKGTDQTYNYGLFDFGQENFLLRFVQGRMWYWMQGFPAQSYVESYRRDNRSVWVQELEMTPAAKRELQKFLEWNERPENRFYHYDYYRDNCSTRVRDALDAALGGMIRRGTQQLPTGRSYRYHTQRLTANDPPIYTGLLLALGQPVDRPISAWEEMFLPLAMRIHLRKLTVTLPDGRVAPLVRSERTLFQSSVPAPSPAPPSWLTGYLTIGALLGALFYALGSAAPANRAARFGFLATAYLWLLGSGIAGVVVAGLWGLTDHAAAYNNENVLQLSLLALPLLWFTTRLTLGVRSAARPAVVLAGITAALSVAGLLLQVLPGFFQVNGGIIALALPANLGVFAGVLRLARKREYPGLPAMERNQGTRTRRAPSRASG